MRSSYLPDTKFHFSSPLLYYIQGRFFASGLSTLTAISSLVCWYKKSENYYKSLRAVRTPKRCPLLKSLTRQTEACRRRSQRSHVKWAFAVNKSFCQVHSTMKILKTSLELKYVRKQKLARTLSIFYSLRSVRNVYLLSRRRVQCILLHIQGLCHQSGP